MFKKEVRMIYTNINEVSKKYKIIYADPPWEYLQSGSKKHSRGMAKQHYTTMATDDICNLPVKDMISSQCICFLWSTFPNISESLKVMDSWGFKYKTVAFTWIKRNKKSNSLFWGMGAYTRANAEVCLLGISPKLKSTEFIKSHKVHSVVISPIEYHSKKPNIVRDKILELCGDLPRIELFARQEIEGWDCFGNEIKRGD